MAEMSKAQWNARATSRRKAFAKATEDAETITLTITIGDQTLTALMDARAFESGAVGIGGQVRGDVGGVPLAGYVSLTVPGTKPKE